MRRRTLPVVLGAAAVLASVLVIRLIGLDGDHATPQASARSSDSWHPSSPAALPTAARSCVQGALVRLGGQRIAYAVTVRTKATAYRAPSARPFATFGHLNANGVPTVFGVRSARVDARCRPLWYRVQLPLRPNGVAGWVRAADVTTSRVSTRILVDLSSRSVTLYDRGKRVMSVHASIGAPATPTPVGSYYVNQRLLAANPKGAFGPGALGISAFSPVLRNWAQGGPIAIHGTDRADLIGDAVSHGCVRVRNAEVLRLLSLVPEGTPVRIRM